MSLDTYFKSCSNQIPRKQMGVEKGRVGVGGLGMRATVRGSDGDGGRGSEWNRVDGGWEISSKIRTIYDG